MCRREPATAPKQPCVAAAAAATASAPQRRPQPRVPLNLRRCHTRHSVVTCLMGLRNACVRTSRSARAERGQSAPAGRDSQQSRDGDGAGFSSASGSSFLRSTGSAHNVDWAAPGQEAGASTADAGHAAWRQTEQCQWLLLVQLALKRPARAATSSLTSQGVPSGAIRARFPRASTALGPALGVVLTLMLM
jgi:hypothetical protein